MPVSDKGNGSFDVKKWFWYLTTVVFIISLAFNLFGALNPTDALQDKAIVENKRKTLLNEAKIHEMELVMTRLVATTENMDRNIEEIKDFIKTAKK